MSESPVELARVRDDSCCRVKDTLQLVGRLIPQSANHETAAIIDSARDERMNECSDRVVIQRTSDATSARIVLSVHLRRRAALGSRTKKVLWK